jgi:YD repeat-containing protein
MKTNFLALVCTLAILIVCVTVPARGQTGGTCITYPSCGWYSFSSGCVPTLPAGATNCQTTGPWNVVCELVSTSCSAPTSFCPTCGKNQAAATRPINLTNGNTYIQENDVRVPGLGGGLSLQRTWNSLPVPGGGAQIGMFGLQWTSTYEELVVPGSGDAVNYMVYKRGDGSLWYFGPSNGSSWPLASPAGITATLTANGTQPRTINFQNGEQRTFNYTTNLLASIIDRNGNTTQLSYDGSLRLSTVTDPVGRHLYFAYNDSNSSQLATSVTSDLNLTLQYSYDSSHRLTQVVNPDLSTISFTYNGQSLITSVTDSNGKILESHTYDAKGRGLTGARAGGVEAVTVSYPTE